MPHCAKEKQQNFIGASSGNEVKEPTPASGTKQLPGVGQLFKHRSLKAGLIINYVLSSSSSPLSETCNRVPSSTDLCKKHLPK